MSDSNAVGAEQEPLTDTEASANSFHSSFGTSQSGSLTSPPYCSSTWVCSCHTGTQNSERLAANFNYGVANSANDSVVTAPYDEVRQDGIGLLSNLSEPFVESPLQEIENGYPLVADLQQLRLQDQICLSVDDVIEQQAFLPEVTDAIEEEHQRLLQDPNITSDEFLERIDRTIGIVTKNGELIRPPLRSSARRTNSELSTSVPTNRFSTEVQISSCQYPLHNAASMGRAVNGIITPDNPIGNMETATIGWQSTKSTLKERFAFLYCSDILADVWFIVGCNGQKQKIPAHKFILTAGSAVFDAMFNGALTKNAVAEKVGGENNQNIELPDVEPAAFLALLKFLYTDDVLIGPEIVMTTLYTAKKYAVPALELACVDFLKRNLGADNAFMLLTQARLFDEPQLASLCLEVIDKNTTDALSAEGFTDIDLETLCMVLKRNTLRIREAPLFLAVLRWSVEECRRRSIPVNPNNQRMVLDKALYMIRFPLMTIDEFAQHAAQTGILTDREVVDLFLQFTVKPKPQIQFLDVPRCCVFGKEVVVSRFQRVEGRWGYSGTPDRIKFTVDRRIYVTGFGLHGSINVPHEYQVTIQILHCGTGKILAHNDTSFSSDGSRETFRVLFKEPVEISPCITYIASACLRGPDSYYGTKGLRRIIHQSSSTGVVTFQFTYAAGNNNGTSVEDGQIPEIIFCTKII